MHKSRFESRDEVQLPFVPQGVAANKCDATEDEQGYEAWLIKHILKLTQMRQRRNTPSPLSKHGLYILNYGEQIHFCNKNLYSRAAMRMAKPQRV